LPKETHPIWQIYLMLASEGGRTEAQGRVLIKSLFPNTYAKDVDTIISAAGNLEELEELAESHRERIEKEAAEIDKAPVNDAIRLKSDTRKDFTAADADINKEIRASRGRKQLVAS
jgi:hypothetical protein